MDTGTPTIDTGDPPRPLLCPPADLEVCHDATDDDGNGGTDCAIEGILTTPWARLTPPAASYLRTGDINGDGADDLVTFLAQDDPFTEIRADGFLGPLPSGNLSVTPDVGIDFGGYNGLSPQLVDLDGDGTDEFLLSNTLDGSWSCTLPEPYLGLRVPFPSAGRVDGIPAAIGTLGAPSWPAVMPTLYLYPAGDLDRDGVDDFCGATGDCSDWRWLLVPGTALSGGAGIDTVHISVWQDPSGAETPSRSFHAGDVDGDGHDDLVVSTVNANSDNRIYIFTEPIGATVDLTTADWVYTTPGVVQHIRSADVTLDGVPDLIISTAFDDAGVFVIENDPRQPAGSITPLVDAAWAQWELPVGTPTVNAKVADLNDDGYGDLAIGVLGEGVFVDHAPCAGVHPLPTDGIAATYGNEFVLMDADGDGIDDVVASDDTMGSLDVVVYLGGASD